MKHLKHLFTALLLLCSTAVVAHDFEVGGVYYNILSGVDQTVEVTYRGTSYSDYSNEYTGSVVIPENVTYNGITYCVTSIGQRAFRDCTGLTSVEIPNNVTSIGDYAFNNCSGLTSVEIGNGVTSIGDNAFNECTGLTSIEIPNSVTSIGDEAFYCCTGLTSISVAAGNAKYDSRDNCNAIIETPTNKLVFGCKNTVIPDEITSIGDNAFAYCSGLTSIVIPNSVTSIGEYAFYVCTGLTSITIPNSVTSIGNWTFYNCTGLTSVVIGNGVTSIGESAFYECTGLASIEIPNSVTSIGRSAFDSCKGLTSIEIPNSVTSIGGSAFSGCTGITSVTSHIPADALFAVNMYVFSGVGKNSCTLYVPYGAKETYAATSGWSAFANIVELIPENALHGTCGADATWILIDGVLTIKGSGGIESRPWSDYAGEIQSIIIEDGITSICNNAFRECSALTSVVIGNGVTSIGGYAFRECIGLTSIEIPNSVTHIGQDAFCRCSNLASVQISESLTTIETGVFSRTGLVNVTIPEGVISIGTYAFDNCPALVNVELPSTLTYIGQYAFENDTHLTSIEIPSSVTSIGLEAFDGCTGLTSITSLIPADALFEVDSYAFNNVNKNVCTLYVPVGSKSTYASTEGWNEFANIVELEPTEVTVNINQYGSATYCSEYALDFSEVEGLKAYSAIGYKPSTQVVTLARVMTTGAGQGVFLKGEPGEYTVPIIDNFDEYTLNMLVGTLEQTTVNSTDGAMSNYKFTIAEGDTAPMFYPFEDGTTLSAGKAYLQIPTAWLPVTAQKSLSVRFDDGETTDIDELKGEDGEVKTIYDLQGRKVENPSEGLYIIDGKKVFIK